MVQSLTEPLTQAAQAAIRADRGSSIAWHGTCRETHQRSCLTRLTEMGSTGIASETCTTQSTRRHALGAIVVYGVAKRSTKAKAQPASEPVSTRSAVPRGVGRRG